MKKKELILEYVKNNPKAPNAEVAQACGTHVAYAAFIRRNEGVKIPKEKPNSDSIQSDLSNRELEMFKRINELLEENANLTNDVIRLSGVIQYLEIKLQHGTSV